MNIDVIKALDKYESANYKSLSDVVSRIDMLIKDLAINEPELLYSVDGQDKLKLEIYKWYEKYDKMRDRGLLTETEKLLMQTIALITCNRLEYEYNIKSK